MTETTFLADKPIRRIGFGAMQLAGPGVFGPPEDPEACRAVLRRAIELGIDHIDTSQFYGPDVVNELIRDTLHPYPDELKLVTKVGARRDEKGGWIGAQSPQELRDGVEENLRALDVERMDLVNLRLMDPGDRAAQGEPTAEQLGVMEDMRQEGKLDLIGVSNVTLDGLKTALELINVAEVQNAFSILDRSDQASLDLCREHEVAYVPYFPLGSAFTGGPKRIAEDPIITKVAQKHEAKPTQIALAWLLAQYERVLLIPGTTSVTHLEENVEAGKIELDEEDLAALAEVKEAGDPMDSVEH